MLLLADAQPGTHLASSPKITNGGFSHIRDRKGMAIVGLLDDLFIHGIVAREPSGHECVLAHGRVLAGDLHQVGAFALSHPEADPRESVE